MVSVIFIHKKIPLRVKYLFYDQLKILLFNPSPIISRFTNKRNLEGVLQVGLSFRQLFNRIVQNILSVHLQHEVDGVDDSVILLVFLRDDPVDHVHQSPLHAELMLDFVLNFE